MEIGDVLVEIEPTSLMERLIVDVSKVEDTLQEKSQRKHENTILKTQRDDPIFCSLNNRKNKGNNILLFFEKRDLKTWRPMRTNSTPTFQTCFFGVFCSQEQKTVLENINQIGPQSLIHLQGPMTFPNGPTSNRKPQSLPKTMFA